MILAHGLGSQKDMGLVNYAREFSQEGFASIIIDYRYFGGSYQESGSNRVRNLIDPWNHVADIKAVLRHLHERKFNLPLDSKSIFLWGTSFAGGHVLKVASEYKDGIKAVISQVPNLDGKQASKRGIKERGILGSIRVAILSLTDMLFATLGLSPIYVKIVGYSDEVSYMIMSEKEQASYYSKHPKLYLGGWRNLTPARTLLKMSFYNPIQAVPNIDVPILFIAATDDKLCPSEIIKQAASLAKSPQLFEVESTHHDIYSGEPFVKVAKVMSKFLKKNL